MAYWVWLLVRIEIGKESSGTWVLLLLGRVQKSSQSHKQTALFFRGSLFFQRFTKASCKQMFWCCIHLVHYETASCFLVINSILNNEVGKLTGEHCVRNWCQRKWGLWLLLIFFFKQWWFGKLALIKLGRSFHSRHGSLPCERVEGRERTLPTPPGNSSS